MNRMKKYNFVAVLFLMSILKLTTAQEVAVAGKLDWHTSLQEAHELSQTSKKPIFAFFTGSDWCGWCIKLDKETFAQPEFKAFAEKNLVLVTVDFPRGKSQSEDVKKQNAELQQKFGVDGFPTLVLVDSKGKEIARNPGYLAGGPRAFIGWVEKSAK